MSLPAISHASHTSYAPFCHAVCCPQRVLCGPRRNFVCPGDMSQQILPCPTPSSPSPSAVVVLVFHGGVSPLSQRNRVCAAWKFDKLPCDFDFIAVLAQNSFLFLFAMANFWFGHFLLRFLRLRLRLDSLLPPHPLLVFFIYFYVFII